jgi:hypothetical protein
MMESLKTLLADRDIVIDATDRRIMCFAHVINLCSGRVIDYVSKAASNNDNSSSSSGGNIIATDPIEVARAAVRAIRETGERRLAFNSIIKSGNEKGWFKAEGSSVPIRLKELQLLRDVRTRWDSVYFMLNRLREMRPVWLLYLAHRSSHIKHLLTNRLQAVDVFLALPDLAKYRISSDNWKAMQDIELVLSVSHNLDI